MSDGAARVARTPVLAHGVNLQVAGAPRRAGADRRGRVALAIGLVVVRFFAGRCRAAHASRRRGMGLWS